MDLHTGYAQEMTQDAGQRGGLGPSVRLQPVPPGHAVDGPGGRRGLCGEAVTDVRVGWPPIVGEVCGRCEEEVLRLLSESL